MKEAKQNFPYAGQRLPPKEQLEDGQAYMTKNGPAKWSKEKQRFIPFTPED
jgi:hypothetical protein